MSAGVLSVSSLFTAEQLGTLVQPAHMTAQARLADGLDCLVCCVIQVICRNDGVLTSLQDFLALLHICALKPYDKRYLQADLHRDTHHSMPVMPHDLHEHQQMLLCVQDLVHSSSIA